MATTKHIERLEKLRTLLRRERRAVAEAVATGSAVDRRDLVEFGQLQRSFDGVDDAIEDENMEAENESERIRLASRPDEQDQNYEPVDDDPK